ncbi:hypothetical protein [Oceaniglobus indicus]|uniref:hypothetical protein n=1 Tax=Oceaniglobus indicus TaxID=2047749 RepID=UPI0011AB70B7|nr:hypothetical protein [Oceaniglobus indicus]
MADTPHILIKDLARIERHLSRRGAHKKAATVAAAIHALEYRWNTEIDAAVSAITLEPWERGAAERAELASQVRALKIGRSAQITREARLVRAGLQQAMEAEGEA